MKPKSREEYHAFLDALDVECVKNPKFRRYGKRRFNKATRRTAKKVIKEQLKDDLK